MKSKEELIEVMARAVISLDYPKGDYNCQTMGDDFAIYKSQAQAALKALCKALPELTYTARTIPGYHGAMTNGVPCEAVDNGSELYNQLKQYGENKNKGDDK